MIVGSAKSAQFCDTGLCPVCPENSGKAGRISRPCQLCPNSAPKFFPLNLCWRPAQAMPWGGSGGWGQRTDRSVNSDQGIELKIGGKSTRTGQLTAPSRNHCYQICQNYWRECRKTSKEKRCQAGNEILQLNMRDIVSGKGDCLEISALKFLTQPQVRRMHVLSTKLPCPSLSRDWVLCCFPGTKIAYPGRIRQAHLWQIEHGTYNLEKTHVERLLLPGSMILVGRRGEFFFFTQH